MIKLKKNYIIKLLCSLALVTSLNVNAIINVDFTNYRQYLTLSGTITTYQVDVCQPSQCGSFNWPISLVVTFADGGNVDYRPTQFGLEYCGGTTAADGLNWAMQNFSKYMLYPNPLINMSPPNYSALINDPFGQGSDGYVHVSCAMKPGAPTNTSGQITVRIPISEFKVINPPNPTSVCSLNSQNLNLNYSSTSLNVDGLTQSTSLAVSCTSGDAKNYQLRLTGSNVTSGRLNFGNGVSAQVSLNGTQVNANGAAISLNGLTSRNISVSATLAGTASSSGVTNANGVLVLDAL